LENLPYSLFKGSREMLQRRKRQRKNKKKGEFLSPNEKKGKADMTSS